MTPLDLLEDVKARFPLLLVQDTGQLHRLLRLALRTYQDKAGHVAAWRIDGTALDPSDPTVAAPPQALAPIGGVDARGKTVFLHETDTASGPVWSLALDAAHQPPYTLRYFVGFTGLDLAGDDLPRGTAGLIGDYLFALLDILNTQRQRQVNQASEIPADHLRGDAELLQAKENVELAMQEQQAIIPSIVA